MMYLLFRLKKILLAPLQQMLAGFPGWMLKCDGGGSVDENGHCVRRPFSPDDSGDVGRTGMRIQDQVMSDRCHIPSYQWWASTAIRFW